MHRRLCKDCTQLHEEHLEDEARTRNEFKKYIAKAKK